MDQQSKDKIHGKRMGWIFRIAAILVILLIITGIILGYFVKYVGHDGDERDGLGRLLDDAPAGLSLIIKQWAGFIWFLLDCIIIFSLIMLTDKLFVKSKTYFTGTRHIDY
jgi:purine-cytosine permease-like protein